MEGMQAESVTGCGGCPAGDAFTAGGQCIGSAGRPCWHGSPFGPVQVTLHAPLAPQHSFWGAPRGGGRWGTACGQHES